MLKHKIIKATEAKKGDYILSHNHKSNKHTFNKILDIFYPKNYNQVKVSTKDAFIRTTKTHPIAVRQKGSIKYIKSEQANNQIGVTLTPSTPLKVEELKKDEIVDLIDFEVKNSNNYYASETKDNFILTHNSRSGAIAFYFNWWDYEIMDLILLKDEGGTDDERLRLPSAQIAIKINKILLDRALKDEEITLFDPIDAGELNYIFGKEFEKKYLELEQKKGIRKKKIKALDLLYEVAKQRAETGNLYIFFNDNVNLNTPYEEPIVNSNLCTEITLPTKPPYSKKQEIKTDLDQKDIKIIEEREAGLLQLCNLSSVNMYQFTTLSEAEKKEMIMLLLEGHYNDIVNAFYPVKEGEIANKLYRPIGVGLVGQAYLLAKNGLKYTDKEALKLVFDVTEDIYYHIYKASVELAKKYGKFPAYNKTKWANGWLPIDFFKEDFNKFADNRQKERWEALREDIKKYGVCFSTHGAVAPTACQTKEGDIITEKGIKTLSDILKDNNVNIKALEKSNIKKWITLKQPIKVKTRFGLKNVYRIWFNGKVKVREIEFEDGKKYKFSYNHMLLVNDNGVKKWVKVKDLKAGMDIVNVNKK